MHILLLIICKGVERLAERTAPFYSACQWRVETLAQRAGLGPRGVRDYHWPCHTQCSENVGRIHTDEVSFIHTETEAW